MASKANIIGLTSRMCRTDTPPVVAGDLEPFVQDALAIYSRDKPYETIGSMTGAGANLLTPPTGWTEGWSQIRRVVYPYEDEDSTVLERDQYTIDSTLSGTTRVERIRLIDDEPSATETVRMWYTKPHTLTESATTIPDQDESAFSHLVASLVETAKASYYLALKDQSVTADLVDYGAKTSEARALARLGSRLSGSVHRAFRRLRMAGSFKAARSASSSFCTTGAGVPRGAKIAFQPWKI